MRKLGVIGLCLLVMVGCKTEIEPVVVEKNGNDSTLIDGVDSLLESAAHTGLEYTLLREDGSSETIILLNAEDTVNYDLTLDEQVDIDKSFEILNNGCSSGKCKYKSFNARGVAKLNKMYYKGEKNDLVLRGKTDKNEAPPFPKSFIYFSCSDQKKKSCRKLKNGNDECQCKLFLQYEGDKSATSRSPFISLKDKQGNVIQTFYAVGSNEYLWTKGEKKGKARKLIKKVCSCTTENKL